MADVKKQVIKFKIGQFGDFKKGRTTITAGKLFSPQPATIDDVLPGVLALQPDEKHHTQGSTSYWHTYSDGYFMVVGFTWDFAPNIGKTYRGSVMVTRDKKHFFEHREFRADITDEMEENGDHFVGYTFIAQPERRIYGHSGSFLTGESGDESFNIDALTLVEFGDDPVPEMA